MWPVLGICVLWLVLQATGTTSAHPALQPGPPVVTIRNGTLKGTYNHYYHQDHFLGVPYASAPIDQLRFQLPRPPTPWNATRDADKYGPWCLGNSLGLAGFSENTLSVESEDCLHANVIRPAGIATTVKLPVLVWIHGGGFDEGSAADQRYNGSFLVKHSVEMGSPIIFVSFNYRLGIFGTIAGPLIERAGLTNLLLRDQRQALAWIQDNIDSFGGDASRVTVMGESAGAVSIGYQLVAYGGRNDGLFHAAIAESGGPFTIEPGRRNARERAADFETVLNITGCLSDASALDCLRKAPAKYVKLSSQLVPRYFTVDGDILEEDNFSLLEQNRFLKVPLMIGTNRNEGAPFMQNRMVAPFSSYNDFATLVRTFLDSRSVPEPTIKAWAELYQDEINNPSIAGLGTVLANPGPSFGPGYGRATLWAGDHYFTAGRRFANQKWAACNITTYGYFFDVVNSNVNPATVGVGHFQEVPYVFGNLDSVGWALDPFPSEPAQRKQHQRLATIMSRMWISFTVTGSPNFHKVPGVTISWPEYSTTRLTNLAFSLDRGIYPQADTWRSAAIDLHYQVEVNT